MAKYTIGIDFGTLSGRAVLCDVANGHVIAARQLDYPHGVIDRALPTGEKLKPDWALQHPQDYLDVLDDVLPPLTSAVNPEDIIGIAVDVTSATAMPVDKDMTPLCFLPEWEHNPYAYVMMWKHHACQDQADRLTAVARERKEPWLAYYGGKINSEWMYPKLLQICEEAPDVYTAMDKYVDAGEWIIWQLCGAHVRSTSHIGTKQQYHLGKYPDEEYFAAVNPAFRSVVKEKLHGDIAVLASRVGSVCPEAAKRWGLSEKTAVAVAIMDAHACVPAAGLTKPGQMLAIIGTSTVHLSFGDTLTPVPGVCCSVQDGVLPGRVSFESGQTCVGDHFRWLQLNGVPGKLEEEAKAQNKPIQVYLTELASKLRPGESGLLALDWWNGNRSILTDSDLTGMMLGMTLLTRPEEIYRALIEATAYGTKMIVENYNEHGVPVETFFASGGISQKNAMCMQIYADVLNMPVHIVDTPEGPALGSAIYAAVAAGRDNGGYGDMDEAIEAMKCPVSKIYRPIPENVEIYAKLFAEYRILHDYFARGENDVMKRLKAIRNS